ncbi:MAG: CoA transferase [Thiolinea sp.]
MYYLTDISRAFGYPMPEVQITGCGDLPSPFRVTELATESMAFAGAMLQRYIQADSGSPNPFSPLQIDRRLASFWFDMTIRPQGWQLPSIWDAIAGNYQAADGWIRLHTNAPHHRQAALSVLNCAEDRDAVQAKVRSWQADQLEAEIVARGGCAATMRSLQDWQQHPQGQAVRAEPLVHLQTTHKQDVPEVTPDPARPLRGIRILDLTRVLAGPVAGRFLAAYGAEVLRIDPPDWDEPGVIPEVVLGKRCARMDLRQPAQLAQFKQLLADCDVLLHGYRPGALDSLNLDEATRRAINPAAIDVSLNAYGWSGPWSERRGFDSLVQMSNGIAHQGMLMAGAEKPWPLPVQALDHATGYLLAAAVLHGLIRRREAGEIIQAKLSLARTGELLVSRGHDNQPQPLAAETPDDLDPYIEHTDWGKAQRVKFPLHIGGCPAYWDYPASYLGSSPASWQG